MPQGRIRSSAVQRDGREAELHRLSRIDARAERRSDHLAAQTYAQGRQVLLQPRGELVDLQRNPGMDVLFINAHWAAHHDQEVRRTQIHMGEFGAGNIDPLNFITSGLDRLEKPGRSLSRHMTDDQCFFHC